jgi:hypothetical protein
MLIECFFAVDVLVPKCLLAGAVHGGCDAEALREEVAAGYLAHCPADKAGTVISHVAVVIRGLVIAGTVTRAAAPGVGIPFRGQGFVKDSLAYGALCRWSGTNSAGEEGDDREILHDSLGSKIKSDE